jgi:mannose-6-phosphate isomerase-like protein (cupin superfamily)
MREFLPGRHLVTIAESALVQLRDGRDNDLVGVTGRPGARAVSFDGQPIGLDEITMLPGTQFDLHEHEGDHILYILEGRGGILIGGVLHELAAGDSVFVPAETPHGVTTVDGDGDGDGGVFRFLAFGIPHHRLDDDDRMRLVELQDA